MISRDFFGGRFYECLEQRILFAAGPAIAGLTIVDALQDIDLGPLAHLGTIDAGAAMFASQSDADRFSLRADTTGPAGSVKFELDPNGFGFTPYTRIENAAPFALFGNNGTSGRNDTSATNGSKNGAKPAVR